jgi:hypothetical protein
MFFNISNHPTTKWSAEQANAAMALGGELRDIQFPNVPTLATTAAVSALADMLAAQVGDNDVAMVQGEFTLVYATLARLRARGIRVVAACTERKVQEVAKSDGTVEKTAIFAFATFRDYE